MASKKSDYRLDRGAVQDGHLPVTALWGPKTDALRSLAVFAGDYRHQFLDALLTVKKAAAHTNGEIGALDKTVARTIGQCCDEILSGQWRDQFLLSTVLIEGESFLQENVNEVLANRSTVILGGHVGKYEHVHPDLHVQLNQLPGEVFQVALRIALIVNIRSLQSSLLDLERLLRRKSLEFERADAVRDLKGIDPAKLISRKLNIFGARIERALRRINDVCQNLLEIHWIPKRSGTEYGEHAITTAIFVEKLKLASNLNFRASEISSGSMHTVSEFVEASTALKELAIELQLICKEVRSEIEEQRRADKQVNPMNGSQETAEPLYVAPLNTLTMVSIDIVSCDMTLSLCAQESKGKRLTLLPLIAKSLLSSLDALSKTLPVFNAKTLAELRPQSAGSPDLRPAHIAQTAHHI